MELDFLKSLCVPVRRESHSPGESSEERTQTSHRVLRGCEVDSGSQGAMRATWKRLKEAEHQKNPGELVATIVRQRPRTSAANC